MHFIDALLHSQNAIFDLLVKLGQSIFDRCCCCCCCRLLLLHHRPRDQRSSTLLHKVVILWVVITTIISTHCTCRPDSRFKPQVTCWFILTNFVATEDLCYCGAQGLSSSSSNSGSSSSGVLCSKWGCSSSN